MRIDAKMPFFPLAHKSFILYNGPEIFKYAILSDRPIQSSRMKIQDELLYKNHTNDVYILPKSSERLNLKFSLGF